MHVQTEQYIHPSLIRSFYEQIWKEIRTNYADREDRHYDYRFVSSRPEIDNLSVTHWKNEIARRMNFDLYSYGDNSPFYAYVLNRPWLRLAYDIAKMTSTNSHEYRRNWLKILFPKLELKASRRQGVRQSYVNPLTFKPSVGFGKTRVLLTNFFPKFIRYWDIKNKPDDTPGKNRILHEYYSKFAESYLYVLSQRQLYYIFPDSEVEEITILPRKKDELQAGLFRLMGISEDNTRLDIRSKLGIPTGNLSEEPCDSVGVATAVEIRQLMEEDRCLITSRTSIEQLIVQNGGYPILDLRPYYMSDDRTKIFTGSSYFYARDMTLLVNDRPEKFIPLKSTYSLYGQDYKKFDNYADILSQVVFDNYRSVNPRPLSMAEYMVLVSKNSTVQYTDGEEIFIRSRRLMIKIFLNKWKEMQVDIPRHFIVFLLNALKGFSAPSHVGGYESIKQRLNHWSKHVGTSNFVKLYDKYKRDFSYLMSRAECEDLFKKTQKSRGNVYWYYSSIRQLHKLYSLLLQLRNHHGQLDQYNLLNVLINIMESRSMPEFTPNAEAIVVYGLLQHIDMFQYFLSDNTAYIQNVKGEVLSKSSIREAFVAILPTCSEDSKKDVESILKFIDDTEGGLVFNNRIISVIKRLYSNYDNEVANTDFDHIFPQTPERAAWSSLAKLLTGCGFFTDYLKLLCPNLLTYVDYATGRPISEFDLRHLIFSSGRCYLINLSHSLDLFEKTGKVFDCNAMQLRYLNRDELSKISKAHPVYAKIFKSVQSFREQHELIPFRLLIGIYRLVTNTNFTVNNRSKNYMLNVRQVDNEENKISDTIYGALMSVVGYVSITIWLQEQSLCYLIDFRKESKNNIGGEIPNISLVNPILQNDLENGISEMQRLEIIYLLRKKGELPSEYISQHELIIEREYSVFMRLVRSLSVDQRNFLNSTNIVINGKAICFWTVLANARFDLKFANKYFLRFINEFYAPFTYSKQIQREYRDIFGLPSEVQARRMVDRDIALDKILISLMTYMFVPPDSIPDTWNPCIFMDVQVQFPQHITLSKIFQIFCRNYMGLTKEESFVSQNKLQALDNTMPDDETSEEKESSEEGEETVRNIIGKTEELASATVEITQCTDIVDNSGKKEAKVDFILDKDDNQSTDPRTRPKITDKLSFQLEVFMEALYKGFDLYHSGEVRYREGYYLAVYEWIDWVVSGEMFADMPILESAEIISITKILNESGLSLPEDVVAVFRLLRGVDVSNRQSLGRENRCVLNILCIKLFEKLSSGDFIKVFKVVFPVLDTELLNKVLRLYLISHHQMNMGYEGLINAIKNVFGLDLFAQRCTSPRSSFLIDTRARLKFSLEEIHAAINGMEVATCTNQHNVVALKDDQDSISSGLEF